LISNLLLPLLVKSNEPRLIFTSSGLHQGKINFDDLEFRKKFSGFRSYRQSKLGVILSCRLLAIKLAKYGVGVYSLHPGVVNTNLGRYAGWFSKLIFKIMGKSPEAGAKTLLYLVHSPKKSLVSGEYYAKEELSEASKPSYDLVAAKMLHSSVNEYLLPFAGREFLEFHHILRLEKQEPLAQAV